MAYKGKKSIELLLPPPALNPEAGQCQSDQ
jgi:hypothetical protein